MTGHLNTLQHKALLGEIVSTRVAPADDSASSDDDSGSRHYSRRSSGGGRRDRGGGPGGLFGHMMGGMFR